MEPRQKAKSYLRNKLRQRQIAREGAKRMKTLEKVAKIIQKQHVAAAAAKEDDDADNPDTNP